MVSMYGYYYVYLCVCVCVYVIRYLGHLHLGLLRHMYSSYNV